MRSKLLPIAVIVSLALAALVRPASADDRDIAPFIDDQTIVVDRIDTAKVDIDACMAWALARLKEQKPGAVDAQLLAQVEGFRRAAADPASIPGKYVQALRQAKCVYWVLSLPDAVTGMEDGEPMGFFVVPLNDDADAKPLAKLLEEQFAAEQIGNCLVMHSPKREIKPGKAPLSETWAAALAARGEADVYAAFVLGEVLRKSFEENLPSQPTPGQPTPILQPILLLTHGMKWVSLSITLPPRESLAIRLQMKDTESAKAANDLVLKLLPEIKKEAKADPLPDVNVDEVIDALTPSLKGDQLLWTFDRDALIHKTAPPLIASMARAREMARRAESASQIAQLYRVCLDYAGNHKGEFPNDLQAALKEQHLSDQLLVNPHFPDRKVGYIYISPVLL